MSIPNYLYALANHKGPATVTAGGMTIPVKIDRVIFNKTVVKCQEGDVYSKETGLALCIAKKALGNKGNFNDVFHEWIPEEGVSESAVSRLVDFEIPNVGEAVQRLKNAMSELFKSPVEKEIPKEPV